MAKEDALKQLVAGSQSVALTRADEKLPDLIRSGSPAARFVWEEFFDAQVSNEHTRKAYKRAVTQFLSWAKSSRLELHTITPAHVGKYIRAIRGEPATRKLALAALRKFFDQCVLRHVIVINPGLSVRGERYRIVEGKTPEISPAQARKLIASIRPTTPIARRDRAIIATLVYTAARVGAVASLDVKHLKQNGKDWSFRLAEKGGKSREIPVRSDLEDELLAYLYSAGLQDADKGSPLFRTARRRSGILTHRRMSAIDICRMVKRRVKVAKLPFQISPHSFRVSTLTDLLESGVELSDIQQFAGHSDPRTTRLYDRRQKNITRNLVERIYDLKLDTGKS